MNEERKWIRLQEAGFLMFLAIPIAILVAGLAFGFTIRGANAPMVVNWLMLIILLLASGGYGCLRYGHDKRVELKNRKQ